MRINAIISEEEFSIYKYIGSWPGSLVSVEVIPLTKTT